MTKPAINTPTLFGAKNNVVREVAPCEPWKFVPNIPEGVSENKQKYVTWRAKPDTEHLVFTASEGLNPGHRCSKDNPIRRLHGLIADYEGDLYDEKILERLKDYRPTWESRTFSKGTRLVWMFEEPVAMEQDLLTENFLKIAHRELLLTRLFSGLDEGAFVDLTKLYDVGHSWRHLGDYALSSATVHRWLFDAAKKTKWGKLNEIKVPIPVVAEEVERQFPNRWEGDFEIGARGVAFFDPSSKNPTSSIVTEAGMVCFNQEKGFYSWAEIFGASFIKRFQDDRIGNACRDVWFHERCYYRKINGVWTAVYKDDFVKWLSVEHDMERVAKNDTASLTTKTEVFIQEHRRVAGVVPRVYDPRDIIEMDGLRYLNNSYVKPVEPVTDRQKWGENFPWIASFIDAKILPTEQPYYFGWQQRYYSTALEGDLQKGHAMFLVGKVKIGKTLFSNKIIGGLMGGFADASAFVTKGSEFNRELLEKGLWVIDDGEVATDATAHRRFSEVVKRVVANPIMQYRAMFRDGQSIKWNGRLVVTLNDDAHSMAMIPDLETSMEEKVMILKFLDTPFKFDPSFILEPRILAELPFFARWILDYEVPEEIVGDARLGVRGHINSDLRENALNAGGVSDFLELIELWNRRMNPTEKFGAAWQGTASGWYAELSTDETLKHLVSKFSVKGLGRKFVEASRIGGSQVSVVSKSSKHKGSGNEYRIELTVNVERRTVKTKAIKDKPATNPVAEDSASEQNPEPTKE